MEKNIRLSIWTRKKILKKGGYVIRETTDGSIAILKGNEEIVNLEYKDGKVQSFVSKKDKKKELYQSVEIKIDRDRGIYLITKSLNGMIKWYKYCE